MSHVTFTDERKIIKRKTFSTIYQNADAPDNLTRFENRDWVALAMFRQKMYNNDKLTAWTRFARTQRKEA